jgi:hypothetical protein
MNLRAIPVLSIYTLSIDMGAKKVTPKGKLLKQISRTSLSTDLTSNPTTAKSDPDIEGKGTVSQIPPLAKKDLEKSNVIPQVLTTKAKLN